MGETASKLDCCSSRKDMPTANFSDPLSNTSKTTFNALPPGEQVELVRRCLLGTDPEARKTTLDFFNKCNERNPCFDKAFRNTDVMRLLVRHLTGPDTDNVLPYLLRSARLFARNPANKILLMKAGIGPPLVQMLRDGNMTVKENAAGVLLNLAAHDRNQELLAQEGAIPLLIDLLKEGSEVAQEKACGVIQNLALNADNQITLARSGAIPPIVATLQHGSDDAKSLAIGAILNMTRNPDNEELFAQAGLPVEQIHQWRQAASAPPGPP